MRTMSKEDLLDQLARATWTCTKYVPRCHEDDLRPAFDKLLRAIASRGPFHTRSQFEPYGENSVIEEEYEALEAECTGVTEFIIDLIFKHENKYGCGFLSAEVCSVLTAILDSASAAPVLLEHYGLVIPPPLKETDNLSTESDDD
jgi:hypothetical protein